MSETAIAWSLIGWLLAPSRNEDAGGRFRRTRKPDVAQYSSPSANASDEPIRSQEHAWILGIRAGQVDVFRTVFDTYAHRLQHFARLWVPRDVAEDIVQDILFDVWRRRADLQPYHNNLTGHLFAAVRNRALNYVQHNQMVQRVESSHTAGSPLGMGTGPGDPDSDIAAEDIRVAIASALATLSELQRAALMLRWGQDMPLAQVAEVLSISENAAKLHVSRARRALAPVLKLMFGE